MGTPTEKHWHDWHEKILWLQQSLDLQKEIHALDNDLAHDTLFFYKILTITVQCHDEINNRELQ